MGIRRYILLVALAAGPLALAAAPQMPVTAPEGASARVANYTIRVRLDARAKTLAGSQTLEWTNDTPATASELWFHLYWNAWRNDRSTWLRGDALRRPPRGRNRREEDFGWIEVDAIRVVEAGGFPAADLTRRMRFASPDDGNPDDRTVLVVPLHRAVRPGETIRVEMDFRSRIPRAVARTGYRGDYFFIAHWFPKLGVFQPDGTWHCRQFHAHTEFFSRFGVYDVQINVPAGWPLGATGVRLGVTENADGTATHRYHQADVHDFTWTTSPSYREATRRFEHPALPAVDIRLLYQPEHAGQVERHFRATMAALELYGLWFGPYPYGHLTVIDPAYGSNSGGMEYPTLFTAGTRYWNPEGGGSPEGVTIHEAGHQFWYGIVASNEFDHAWIDEGFNTYSEERVREARYGDDRYVRRLFRGFVPVLLPDVALNRRQTSGMNRYRADARSDVPATPTFRYHPQTASSITYSKTALWLLTLERTLGWETVQQILSAFFERWKFRHPGPEDFFAVASEISGRDLTFFFDEVYRSNAVFDYAVESVSSRRLEVQGYLEREGKLEYAARPAAPGDRAGLFETRVVVRRLGDGVLPVEVLLVFEDGHQVRQSWDGRDTWKLYELTHSAPLAWAAVDPERKLALDVNFTNNTRRLQPQAGFPATKWAAKWMFWLQDWMQTAAALL